MTNDQKEALKKVFSAYENYIINTDSDKHNSYLSKLLDTIPELSIVFPAISLENDELGLFKNIYFMSKREAKDNKHRALLNNCVDDDEAILHGREIEGVKSDGC